MAAKTNKSIAIVLLVAAALLAFNNLQSFFRITNLEWLIVIVNVAIGVYLLVK